MPMQFHAIVAGIVVAISAASCASFRDGVADVSDQQLPVVEPEREIPDATWVPIFFESVDERTAQAGVDPLRHQCLPADALEVRVWKGFGLRPLEGFILQRTPGGEWSTFHIPANRAVTLNRVDLDGRRLFHCLVDLDLLTLPDSSTLPNENRRIRDGTSYVVEIHQGKSYRTYHYSNPAHQPWSEAEKIMRIGTVLDQTFADEGG